MAATDGKAPAAPTATTEGQKNSVSDFLSAPRRKRKNYLIMAAGEALPSDVQNGIVQFARSAFKGISVAHARSIEELAKQGNRQIVLLVVDDEFAPLRDVLTSVADLKRRKGSTVMPVLFMTRHPEQLIAAYNELLLPYQETDDYLNYDRAPMAHVFSKIRSALANKNRRKSRRYKVDQQITYLVLGDDDVHPGHLLDLSVHGALLRADANRLFRDGEQIKLQVPVAEYLPSHEGDYMKLSARVRRVFIGGSQAGISFEHLTEKQQTTLTLYLTELVNQQSARKLAAMRARDRRA
jgi:hypothetical protein